MRFVFDLIFYSFFAGYFLFIATIPTEIFDQSTKTDALVVLTGASGRIAGAVDLLNKGYAEQLFISGVDPQDDIKHLLKTQGCAPLPHHGNIDLGPRARTTVGNAVETQKWIQDRNIQSIRLVTSSLHMRRSLLEFARIAPSLTVVPHPVNVITWSSFIENPKLVRISLLEYSKYLMALLHVQRAFRQNLSPQ